MQIEYKVMSNANKKQHAKFNESLNNAGFSHRQFHLSKGHMRRALQNE